MPQQVSALVNSEASVMLVDMRNVSNQVTLLHHYVDLGGDFNLVLTAWSSTTAQERGYEDTGGT